MADDTAPHASPIPLGGDIVFQGAQRAPWRWRVGRILALVGTPLLTWALWAPWGYEYLPVALGNSRSEITFALLTVEPGSYGSLLALIGVPVVPAFVLWSALSVLGLLLCPLLWQVSRPRLARLVAAVYTVWFVVMAVNMLYFELVVTLPRHDPFSTVRGLPRVSLVFSPLLQVKFQGDSVLSGFLLNPAFAFVTENVALVVISMGLCLGAVICLRSTRWPRVGALPRPPRRRVVFSAALVTVGAGIWACGYFLVPWAQALAGAVSGPPVAFLAFYERVGHSPIASYVVSIRGTATHPPLPQVPRALDPLAALYALSALLLGGAFLLAIIVWWRGVSRAWVGWSLCWLAFAAGIVLFNAIGVLPAEVAYPERFVPYGPGPLVCALGLLLVAVGLICAIMYRKGAKPTRAE